MFPVAVALSICGLLVGPSLGAWARGRTTASAALDAATLALVPGVILLRLLPHLVEDAGVAAIGCFTAGYVGLALAEARAHGRTEQLGIAIVLPTLVVHSFVDGAALGLALGGNGLGSNGAMLAVALVAHRLPEGMFFASAMAGFGTTRTRWAIAAVAGATVVGSLTGRELLAHAPDQLLHLIVALGLGVMLRLVVHRHDHGDHEAPPTREWVGGVTFVLCLAGLIAIPSPQHLFSAAQPHELSAVDALVPLFLETATVLLPVLLLAEAITRLWPRDERLADPWAATLVLAGDLLGVCVAVARGLVVPVLRAAGRRVSGAPLGLSWPGMLFSRPSAMLARYCIGVVLAVAAEAALPADCLAGWEAIALPVAVLVAAFVWDTGCGAVLVAAVLLHKGVALPVALAYLFAHAAVHVPSRGVRLAIAAVAALLGYAVAPLVSECALPALHALGHHVHSLGEWASAAAVAVWIVTDLALVGPRRWLSRGAGDDPA